MIRARWRTSLTLVLLASAIACAAPTQQPEPVTITFACRNYLHDWYEGLAEAFHKEHPYLSVQVLSADEILSRTAQTGVYTASWDDITKIARAADTFLEDARMLGERPQDVALDLADRAARDAGGVLEDTYPSALALFTRGDRLWGLPFEVDPLVIYFNPRRFDEAGVPHPRPGWTWDDLLDAAVRLTIREGDRVQAYGYVDPWTFYTLPLLAHQKAGALIESRHEIPQGRLDAPGVAEALRWYAGLVREYGVMPDPTETDPNDLRTIVYERSPAIWVGGSWEWNNYTARQETGVVPLPESDRVGAAYISARGYLISAGTRYPDAAWQWIEWLSRQPPARFSQGVPARQSAIEASNDWEALDGDLAAAFQYSLEHAVDYPGFLHAALSRAFEAVLGGTPAETALAEAQANANQALSSRAQEAEQPGEAFVVAGPEPAPTPGGTVIHFFVVEALGADWGLYRALADRFHKAHPEFVVEIEAGSQPPLAGVRGPADCFVDRAGRAQLGSEGGILPLDPLLAGDEAFDRDVFYPDFLRQVEVDGKLMALPLETSTKLLYYNRALFDRAGLPYPTGEWTPQHLIEQAVALTDTRAPEPVYGFAPREDVYSNAPEYVAWLGGRLFDADGRPTFDDSTLVAAMAAYADLVRSSPPGAQRRGVARWSGEVVTVGAHPAAVSSGRVAMWVDAYDRHLGAPPLDFEVGLAPLPAGAASMAYAPSRALYIRAQTGVPDACWAWMTFLSAQPDAVQWLPVRRDAAAGDAWRARAGEETAAAWSAILSRGGPQAPSWDNSTASTYALYWLDEALADLLAGMRAADALAEAQARASVFVSCMSGSGDPGAAWPACARQADPGVVLPGE